MVKIDCEDKEVLGSKQTELTKMFSRADSVAVAFRKALAVLPRAASPTQHVQLSLRSCLLAPRPDAGTALEDTGRAGGWGGGQDFFWGVGFVGWEHIPDAGTGPCVPQQRAGWVLAHRRRSSVGSLGFLYPLRFFWGAGGRTLREYEGVKVARPKEKPHSHSLKDNL